MLRLLTVLMTCLGGAAAAQDHLEPENSIYGGQASRDEIFVDYDLGVTRKFKEIYTGPYAARAIIIPSFETEYAIAVSGDPADAKLVGLRAASQLWLYSILREFESGNPQIRDGKGNEAKQKAMKDLRASLPPAIEDVELARCEMPITAKDHAVLTGLWRSMLYAVRFRPKGLSGLDGVRYHYSGNFDFQSLAGQTWSPASGTRLDRFTQMTERLYAACEGNDPQKLAASISEAQSMCAEVRCGAD
ncbi:MAG: hypothetical protein ACKVS5_08140 [Parvularculaceae bacterium]